MRRIGMLALLVATLLAGLPAVALGSPRVTSHVVSQTSGVAIAEQLISQTKGLQLGATAATVTLDVAGHAKPVRLDFGELAGGAEGSGGSGLLVLAMVPLAASVFFRTVRFLSDLGK